MHGSLIRDFREYSDSAEAHAVLFVKEHVRAAKGHWVHVEQTVSEKRDYKQFRYVSGRLYKRTIKPKYPAKSKFIRNGKVDHWEYYLNVKAITWTTAQEDIEKQRRNGVKALVFRVKANCIDINEGKFFTADAPQEIKDLAKNLTDRRNPLWSRAEKYFAYPKFIYRLKKVAVYRDT